MSNNLSSRQLRYVSITVLLFLGLNLDFGLILGLIFSHGNGFSLFLKCHISQSFLLYSSNSLFNFGLSVLLAVGTNFRPLDKRQISASERFYFKRLITLLLTNSSSNLPTLNVAILFMLSLPSISGVFSALLIMSFSPP